MEYAWLIVGIVVSILVVVAVTVIVWGACLPIAHVASRAVVLNASPDEVWRLIEDVNGLTSWRRGMSRVEIKDVIPDSRAWIEHTKQGVIPLRVVKREAPRLLVVRIDTDKLPFGGTWTYELQPMSASQTRLRITEHGIIKPPPFRFMARYVFGMTSTIEGYLRDVAKRFASEPRMEP